MGREVRRVTKEWRHPRGPDGGYVPLLGTLFLVDWTAWEMGRRNWEKGRRESWMRTAGSPAWVARDSDDDWAEWCGDAPKAYEHMPPEAFGDWWMMYEDTSEGTPLHDLPMRDPDERASHLEATGASRFGRMTATTEEWRYVIGGGWGGMAFTIPNEAAA